MALVISRILLMLNKLVIRLGWVCRLVVLRRNRLVI